MHVVGMPLNLYKKKINIHLLLLNRCPLFKVAVLDVLENAGRHESNNESK